MISDIKFLELRIRKLSKQFFIEVSDENWSEVELIYTQMERLAAWRSELIQERFAKPFKDLGRAFSSMSQAIAQCVILAGNFPGGPVKTKMQFTGTINLKPEHREYLKNLGK